jgi:hypothetical protein
MGGPDFNTILDVLIAVLVLVNTVITQRHHKQYKQDHTKDDNG